MSEANHRISNYENYFNKAAKRTRAPVLRSLRKYMGTDLVFLAGGIPNTDTFPIAAAQLRLKDGQTVHIDEADMKVALQYGATRGMLQLREWLTELQRRLHDPPTLPPPGVSPSANSDMITITANGCTEAFSKILGMVLEEGDSLLAEESTYPSVFNVTEPLGCKPAIVKNDADGLIPSDLSNVLCSWNEATSGPRPKLLYCVPNGGNPTGANLTLERRKEIYALARKYDLLIIEDDPYHMIQYSRPLLPSLLSMDVDGRVLRCDTVSKIMSAGYVYGGGLLKIQFGPDNPLINVMSIDLHNLETITCVSQVILTTKFTKEVARLGYVSGPKQFLDRIIDLKEGVSGGGSTLVETIMLKVFQNMGHDGYIEHGCRVANFYHKRSQLASRTAEKHLRGLAEWSAPQAGMFLWMKLLGVEDSRHVCQKLIQKGAVVVQGHIFCPASVNSPYIRVSFSYASEADLNKTFSWLAEILKEQPEQ